MKVLSVYPIFMKNAIFFPEILRIFTLQALTAEAAAPIIGDASAEAAPAPPVPSILFLERKSAKKNLHTF